MEFIYLYQPEFWSCRNFFSLFRQLPTADDVLLVLIRLIWLLPSRGCNPNSKANATLIKAIDVSLFSLCSCHPSLCNDSVFF